MPSQSSAAHWLQRRRRWRCATGTRLNGGRAVHGDPHVGIRNRPAQWSRGHEPSSAAAQSSSIHVTEITDLGHASIPGSTLSDGANTDVTFTHTSMGPSSASILEADILGCSCQTGLTPSDQPHPATETAKLTCHRPTDPAAGPGKMSIRRVYTQSLRLRK